MSNHDREGSLPPSRDDDLARAWREASDEQPSSQLDAAIIAAARKAVADGGGQPMAAPARVRPWNWLLQWQPLAAAATVAGLAFVLVQMLPREHDVAPSMRRTESTPVPAPVESQPRRSSVPAATDSSPLPSADKALARPEQVVVPDRAPVPGQVPESPGVPASPVMTDSQTAAPADTAAAGEAACRSTRGHATGAGGSKRERPGGGIHSRKGPRRRRTARRGGMVRKGRGAARERRRHRGGRCSTGVSYC